MFEKKYIILIAVLLLSLLGTLYLVSSGLKTEVHTATVAVDTAVDAVPAIVNVRSDYTMTLSGEEAGRVIDSSLVLGAEISEGQLVLEIDSTDLKIEIDALKTELDSFKARIALKAADEAALLQRKEDLQNLERLYDAGSYPELEIERQRRNFEVFKEGQASKEISEQQQLAHLETRLERLQRRLEKTQVYAPSDGIVTRIYAHPGELIGGGSPLAEVFSKALVVEARINEEDFAGVQSGMTATVRLLSYGDRLFDAVVDRVIPTANPETQQYTVLLEMEIDPDLLMPGLSGEASIVRRKIPNSLVVSRRALVGNAVFKVVDGVARLTPVKVGVRGLYRVEIEEGLQEGDRIVIDGMAGLRDGDRVKW